MMELLPPQAASKILDKAASRRDEKECKVVSPETA
jgi:hypothetical protein